jgi:nitroimidazol reductase NimA-like FMN-containing flavoprotein (pyridoxamine 5'-phosphate oxidase superfamily)
MVRTFAAGAPACLTVTLIDGLVLARSAFHHSMNYRSAVLLGTLRPVEDDVEKLRALEAFTDGLMPGRWAEVRRPNRKELKATTVLAMRLDEASAKVRDGGAIDDGPDYELPVWAGVVPLVLTPGAPEPDERLADGAEVPGYVRGWGPSSRGSR